MCIKEDSLQGTCTEHKLKFNEVVAMYVYTLLCIVAFVYNVTKVQMWLDLRKCTLSTYSILFIYRSIKTTENVIATHLKFSGLTKKYVVMLQSLQVS